MKISISGLSGSLTTTIAGKNVFDNNNTIVVHNNEDDSTFQTIRASSMSEQRRQREAKWKKRPYGRR